MKEIPNDMVTTLVRNLPIILDAVKPDPKDTRLANAVRLTKKQLNKLNKMKR